MAEGDAVEGELSAIQKFWGGYDALGEAIAILSASPPLATEASAVDIAKTIEEHRNLCLSALSNIRLCLVAMHIMFEGQTARAVATVQMAR